MAQPALQYEIPAPVAAPRRILTLDVLRGVAVLGILLMNIQSFAMPEAVYSNPAAWHSIDTPGNFLAWMLTHLLVEQKMMTLFALLFGAGVALQADRLEHEPPGSLTPAVLHYRRMIVLLFIGLAHAYLLWFGDILVAYALCGMIVYPLRRLRPVPLLAAGVAILAFQNVVSYIDTGPVHSHFLLHVRSALRSLDITHFSAADEVLIYRDGYLAQMIHRVPESFTFQTYVFLGYALWRSAGLMLVGAAILRLGLLTNARSRWWLYLACFIGLAGLAATSAALVEDVHRQWSPAFYFYGAIIDYWASIAVAFGYAAGILLLLQSPLARLLSPFAAVGKMALTNYLLQTLICTSIYYGHGLGRFGDSSRVEQLFIVLCVWIVLLVLSNLWLAFFRFGAAEWLWRGLTYGRFPPMRISTPPAAVR